MSIQPEEDLISMLTYRDVANEPLLVRASEIIKNKVSDSTPHQLAIIELIQTCKNAETNGETSVSAEQVKEVAKQVYSIKATDISLTFLGAKSPEACSIFCGRTQTSWFSLGKRNVDANDPFDPFVERNRAACLGEYWKVDNIWTSYSNNLQDANTLCAISSIEHAPRLMLELLKDFTDVIPAMVDMLRQQEAEHNAVMERARRYADELNEMHHAHMHDAERYHEDVQRQVKVVLDLTRKAAEDLTRELRSDLAAAGNDFGQINYLISNATDSVTALQQSASITFRHFQTLSLEATSLQAKGLESIQDAYISTVSSLVLAARGLEEQIGSAAGIAQSRMSTIVDAQEIAIRSQAHLLSMQNDTIETQHKSLEISQQALSVGQQTLEVSQRINATLGELERLVRTLRFWHKAVSWEMVMMTAGIALIASFVSPLDVKKRLSYRVIALWIAWKLLPTASASLAPQVYSVYTALAHFGEAAATTTATHLKAVSGLASVGVTAIASAGLWKLRRSKMLSTARLDVSLSACDVSKSRNKAQTFSLLLDLPVTSARAQTVPPDFGRPYHEHKLFLKG